MTPREHQALARIVALKLEIEERRLAALARAADIDRALHHAAAEEVRLALEAPLEIRLGAMQERCIAHLKRAAAALQAVADARDVEKAAQAQAVRGALSAKLALDALGPAPSSAGRGRGESSC